MDANTIPNRFKSFSNEELDSIISNIDSENTVKSTTLAMNVLRSYCQTKDIFSHLLPLSSADISKETLNEILYSFYAEVRNSKGEQYKKMSLDSIKYGINRYFKSIWQKKGGIDIVNDQEFQTSNNMYKGVVKLLKAEGKCEIEHYGAIEISDMRKIEAYFRKYLGNPQVLQQKVFFDIILHFGNRGRENLREMKISDFIFNLDPDNCEYICKKDDLSKNHQTDTYSKQASLFANENKGDMCPVNTFKRYVSMLNSNCIFLFQRVNKKGDNCFFDNSPLGVKTIGSFMKKISQSAKLSKLYTNHSIRSTCITLLNEEGVAATNIIKITGHSSVNSLKTYTDRISCSKRKEMCSTISDGIYTDTAPKIMKAGPSATIRRPTENVNELSNDDGMDDILANLNVEMNNANSLNNGFQPIFHNCKVTINNYNFKN